MSWLSSGISITVALFAFLAAIGVWVWAGEKWRWLAILLFITAASGVAGTKVGDLAHDAIYGADKQAAKGVGLVIGAYVSGLLALVTAAITTAHVATKHISVWTIATAIATPISMALIPGPVGEVARWLVRLVAYACGGVIGLAFGL